MSRKKPDSLIDSKEPFEEEKLTHHQSIHEEVHGSGHGGAEMGWLVSYADLMTLLFGLFVILFSLATDKTKDMDDVMKQVSQKYFSQNSPPQNPQVPVEPPVESIKQSAAAVAGEQSADEQSDKNEQALADLLKQIESLKSENEKLSSKSESTEKEKKTLQRKVASVEDEQSKKVDTQVESLEQELAEQKIENQKLKEELSKKQPPMQNYMMVLLTWETEKHDLDLQIVSPTKKVFNFKRRQFAGEPGHFELDNRFGPGIEMWKAENFNAGTYEVRALFYSKNGNEKPVKLHLTVITNLSTFKSPNVELKSSGDFLDIPFNIDAEGTVIFQK